MTTTNLFLNYPKELKNIIQQYSETTIKVVSENKTRYCSTNKFLDIKDKRIITKITVYGNWILENPIKMFQNSKLKKFNIRGILKLVGSCESMFLEAEDFNCDASEWDVSNVTDMNEMFCASGFRSDISGWNVSNVTDMSVMFCEVQEFNSDLSMWDVSKVTDMSNMFCNTLRFNSDLSMWNVSNVTNMCQMFYESFSFNTNGINTDFDMWDMSKVTNNKNMFYN